MPEIHHVRGELPKPNHPPTVSECPSCGVDLIELPVLVEYGTNLHVTVRAECGACGAIVKATFAEYP